MPFMDLEQPLPSTPEHWHAVAMHAAGQLMIDAFRDAGWLTGGPAIDRARCEELLTLAAAQDIIVSPEQAANAGIAFWAGWNDTTPSPYEGIDTPTLAACASETCEMELADFRQLTPGERRARVDVLDELANRWAAGPGGPGPRAVAALDAVRLKLRVEVSR